MTTEELENRLRTTYSYQVKVLEIKGENVLVSTPKYRRWVTIKSLESGEHI